MFCGTTARSQSAVAPRHYASGFGIKISRTIASKSWHAVMNCRKVRRVGAKESNSSIVKPALGVRAPEIREFPGKFRPRSPARTGSSIRERTSMSLALNRTCQGQGGEITMSPPMNSLQCM